MLPSARLRLLGCAAELHAQHSNIVVLSEGLRLLRDGSSRLTADLLRPFEAEQLTRGIHGLE
jgi:hypothetical protein